MSWILCYISCFLLGRYGNVAAHTILGRSNIPVLKGIFNDDPDIYRNVSELITSKGYPLEEHTVQTGDGYLLSVQRIPHGRKSSSDRDGKDAVLLIHGVLEDSTIWVLNFPNQSLGFILPDKGYDVWLLNVRGCTYSKRHLIYTTNQRKFWNFSFDQMAQYDVPDTIDYILEHTGKEQLYIIGHSQGNAATLGMLSEMPDYNEKVKLFIALAPGMTVGQVTSLPMDLFVATSEEILFVYDTFNSGEFLPNDKASMIVKEKVCTIAPAICEVIIFSAVGEDRKQLNETRLGVYGAHLPAGTSTKSMRHIVQIIKSKKPNKYDYGKKKNLKYYHQKDPPEYNASVITTPVAFFWSTNDALVGPEDVELLRRKLNSLVFDYKIPYPYNHLDYFLAMNSFKFIVEPILQLLPQY